MSGKTCANHICDSTKVQISDYKKSISDSTFTDAECRLIWDFYVSKSFASDSGCSIKLEEYGWKKTTNRTDGLPALEKLLAAKAGIDEIHIIRCNTIKDTLSAMDLSKNMICIEHPRAVIKQEYSLRIDENEAVIIDNRESRINALFRHIRNSLAHGNTYFFDNSFCMLEDYEKKDKCSAKILMRQQTLIDWIFLVDKKQKYFKKIIENGTPITEIIEDIKIALKAEAYRSALALSLTLPDVCAHVEKNKGKTNGEDYIEWFDKYIDSEHFKPPLDCFDNNRFDGHVCYSLRCAVLHQGNTDIKDKTEIEDFAFSLGLKNHSTYEYKVKNADGAERYITKIDIVKLCEIICEAALSYYNSCSNKHLFEKYRLRIEEIENEKDN